MEINLSKQPAIAPAPFGMPSCGHAFETFGPATGLTVGAGTTSVVRDRRAVAKADMGIATTYVPGTSAWRPPSS